MADRHCLNLIAGDWRSALSGRTYSDHNPATGELVATVADSGREDLEAAIAAAHAAFPAWRLTPAPRRGEVLFRAAHLLAERKEEMAQLLTREMGKPIAEARGDVQEAIDMAYFMGGEGRRLFGQTVPAELPNKFAMSVRDPIGVVGVITPWNFPVAVPSWKILPALICGNTIVFKPSPETPLLATLLAGALQDAGLPPGVLNVVVGRDPALGAHLLADPRVPVISFTGSTATGRIVAAEAGRLLKRVCLELGGKNAVVVLADADLDLAVDGILWSAFGTSGQRCTACSRVIVERAVSRELTERLAAAMKQLVVGNGLDPAVHVGPLIDAKAVERVAGYVSSARQEGISVLQGGSPITDSSGHFFAPTLLGGVRPHHRLAQEEVFGPVLSVIEVDDLAEAVAVNNGTPFGLSSSIFTQDVNKAFAAIRDLATGIVYVNAGTTGSEVQLPFGGTRDTGNGMREAGQAALDTFSEWKSVYVDYSGRLQRAQIDR